MHPWATGRGMVSVVYIEAEGLFPPVRIKSCSCVLVSLVSFWLPRDFIAKVLWSDLFKKVNTFFFFLHKSRTIVLIKNLRHISLLLNVFDLCTKCHVDDFNIKRDIHVQKIKVEK